MTALSSAETFGHIVGLELGSPLRIRQEPCDCGGWIVANADDPGPAVARHNETITHRAWWARVRREWQGDEEP